MKISRKSPVSGEVNTLEIDVTDEEMAMWKSGSKLIQQAMPRTTDGEREFLMTGITETEWDAMFAEDEDE